MFSSLFKSIAATTFALSVMGAQAASTVHFKKPETWDNVYLSQSCLIRDVNGKFLGFKETEKLTPSKYGWVDVTNISINSKTGTFCFYGSNEKGTSEYVSQAFTEDSFEGTDEIYIRNDSVFYNKNDMRIVTAHIGLDDGWQSVYQREGDIQKYVGTPTGGWFTTTFPIETIDDSDYDTLETFKTEEIIIKIITHTDDDGVVKNDTIYKMEVEKITQREDEEGFIINDTTFRHALDTIYDTKLVNSRKLSYYAPISLANEKTTSGAYPYRSITVTYSGYTSDYGSIKGELFNEMYVFTNPVYGGMEKRAVPPTVYTLHVLPPQNASWSEAPISMSGNNLVKEFHFKADPNNCQWRTATIYDEDLPTISTIYRTIDKSTWADVGSYTFNLKNKFTTSKTTELYVVADDAEEIYWYTEQPSIDTDCSDDSYKRIYVQTGTKQVYASKDCSILDGKVAISKPNEDELLTTPFAQSELYKFDVSTKNYLVNDTVSVCFYEYDETDEEYNVIAEITESSFKGGPDVYVYRNGYSTTIYNNYDLLKNMQLHVQVPENWTKVYQTKRGSFELLKINDGWVTPDIEIFSSGISLNLQAQRCKDTNVVNVSIKMATDKAGDPKLDENDQPVYDTTYSSKTISKCTEYNFTSKSRSFGRFSDVSVVNNNTHYPTLSITLDEYPTTDKSLKYINLNLIDIGDVYLIENPRKPGATLVHYGKPDIYWVYVLPPQTTSWINEKPILQAKSSELFEGFLDKTKCGWYYIPLFVNEIPEAARFISNRNDGLKFGIDGTGTAFNLKKIFNDRNTHKIYIIANSYKGQYLFTADPQYDGICEFPLMGILYDTDAKLHPAFSCYSAGGEGCQTGAQSIPSTMAVAAVNECMGVTTGIVDNILGDDGKPVLTANGKKCFINDNLFNQLFNSTEGVNERSCASIPLTKNSYNKWEFSSDDYLSPGAPVVGGYYPAENITNDDIIRYNGNAAVPTPIARTKRTAEGPVFMGPQLRALDETEEVMKINTLCNGPGWLMGMECEGYFANGDDITMEYLANFIDVDYSTDICVWGWSCQDKAPAGWPAFASSSGEKQIGTVGNISSTSSYSIRWTGTRNQHFCFESHARFTYQKGQRFGVRGDDDIWVFIGGRLAIDLGGSHMAAPGYVNLDIIKDKNGDPLVEGQKYDLDFFFCDRRTTMSNMNIFSNIYLDQVTRRAAMEPCYIAREHVFDDDVKSERYEIATSDECAGDICSVTEEGVVTSGTSSAKSSASTADKSSASTANSSASTADKSSASTAKSSTSTADKSSASTETAENSSGSTKPASSSSVKSSSSSKASIDDILDDEDQKSSSSTKRSSSSKGSIDNILDDDGDDGDDGDISEKSSSSKKRSSSSRRSGLDDDEDEEAIIASRNVNLHVVARDRHIFISGGAAGTMFNLMDMQGRTLESFVATRGNAVVPVKSAGTYLLKYGSTIKTVVVKD